MVDDLAELLSESFADATVSIDIPRRSAAGSDEVELAAGTLTFLLTDIEGSSRLWETEPEAMEVALQQHDRLSRRGDRRAWRDGGRLPRGG